jgi:hypothetical protein
MFTLPHNCNILYIKYMFPKCQVMFIIDDMMVFLHVPCEVCFDRKKLVTFVTLE